MKQKVHKNQFFMCYKHLPEDVTTVGFYFSRSTSHPVPVPASLEEARSVLPGCFETGTVNGKLLNALERVLKHLYVPMLMLTGRHQYMHVY